MISAPFLQRSCWATLYFALEPIYTIKTINMTPLLGSYAKYTVSHSPHTPFPYLEHHQQQRPRPNQHTPNHRFHREFFMQEDKSKHKRDDHAKFIDCHYFRRLAHLQRHIVEKPRCASCQSGQYKENPALCADCCDSPLIMRQKNDSPRHHNHNKRSDSRCQMRIHPFNSNLRRN